MLHIALVAFLSLNPWPTIVRIQPTAYSVTLMPISIQEPEVQPPPLPAVKQEVPKKPIEKPKKDDIVEKIKKPQKEKGDLKHLQEAIEEIRKKVALDEIKKKVAKRKKAEERPKVVSPPAPIAPPPSPVISSSKMSPSLESKLEDLYGNLVWLKIKEAWTIPENLLQEMLDLETIIVIIIDRDGRVQKWLFEKKSGNAIYDQSALRAILKAEPLPPIPKELGKEKVEFGFRFLPD